MKKINLFICYVGKDSEKAISFAKEIEKQKHDDYELDVIYMDEEGVGCANDWEVWSEENIKNSDIIMQIWTKNTMESILDDKKINDKVIRSELRLARSLNKQIIILDYVGEENYAEGFDIASKTLSKTYMDEYSDNQIEKVLKAVEDRIYKVLHNEKPDYLLYQKVIKSSDSMGTLGNMFVGRTEELKEIDDFFNEGKNIVILSGEGGIGKTEIAKEYAKEKTTKDLFAFKVCSNEHDLKLSSVILSFDYENDLDEEDKNKSDYEKALIRINQLKDINPRFILIIDNFNSEFDEEENKKIINKLSESINFKIIISSRCKTTNQSVGFIRIDSLDEKDQIRLFYNSCNYDRVVIEENEDNDKKILELSKVISGHTMTLDLCARIINDKGYDIDRLKETLLSEKSKVRSEHTSHSSEELTISNHLLKLFEIADLKEEQKDILYVLSYIPQHGLSFDEINNIKEINEDDLKYLCNISLIKRNKANYYLHPLVSNLAFNEYKDCREKIAKKTISFILEDYRGNGNDSSYELKRKKDYQFLIYERLLSRGERNRNLALSYDRLGYIEKSLSNYREAKSYYLKALEIRKAQSEFSSKIKLKYVLSVSYNNLGDIEEKLSNYEEAKLYYLKGLKIREELDSSKQTQKSKHDLSYTYSRLGNFEKNLKNYKEAKKYYLKSLEITEELIKLPNNNEKESKLKNDLSISYNNLGDIAMELFDYDEAKLYHLKALKIREEQYREDDPRSKRELAFSYNGLGNVAMKLCHYDEAKSYYLRALEIRLIVNEILNRSQTKYDLSTSYINLGNIELEQKKYDDAKSYYLKSLEIREELNELLCTPLSKMNVAISYNKLGDAERCLCNYIDAKSYYLKSLKIYEDIKRLYNKKDYYEIVERLFDNIASVSIKLKEYSDVVEYYSKELELVKDDDAKVKELNKLIKKYSKKAKRQKK